MKALLKKVTVLLLFVIASAALITLCACNMQKDNMSNADYIFDANDSGNDSQNQDGALGSQTLITLTVTYADGDEILTTKTVVCNSKAESVILEDTADYTFDGWTLDGEKYDFTKPVTQNIRLEACWIAVEHTAKFIVSDTIVGVRTFTADNKEIDEPAPPEKAGFYVKWQEYELGSCDVEIRAVYEPITYTVQYIEVSGGEPVDTQTCTVYTKDEITPPPVPERDGYIGKWGEPQIDGDRVYIYAEYTANSSTPTDPPLDEPPKDEPADEPTDKPTDNPTDNPADKPTDDPNKDEPTDKPADEGGDKDNLLEGTEGLIYGDTDGGLTVTGYDGAGTKIVIPSSHDGKPVVSVGENAFMSNGEITEVYICDGIIKIENSAFYLCTSLEKVTLPASLETIGAGAFQQSGIKSIELPAKIKSLQKNTFANCANLESVVLPQGLTEIGAYAFSNCVKLKSINLDNVLTIKTRAFANCTSLTGVKLN